MFYNNYYSSNYEELLTYYPKFYRDVLEMRAVLEAEGKIADDLQANIEQVFDDCFIDTADESTIRSLEKFLFLGLYKQRSLEERRRLVKSLFVGSGKVSASMLSEMISAYTGAAVTVTFEPFDAEGNNKLNIEFDRGSDRTLYMSDILTLIEKRIPAHIEHESAVVYSFPVGVEKHAKSYLYAYDLCGTKPEPVLFGQIHQIDVAANSIMSAGKVIYPKCGTESGGTKPEPAAFGNIQQIDAATNSQVAVGQVEYTLCGTEYAG